MKVEYPGNEPSASSSGAPLSEAVVPQRSAAENCFSVPLPHCGWLARMKYILVSGGVISGVGKVRRARDRSTLPARPPAAAAPRRPAPAQRRAAAATGAER